MAKRYGATYPRIVMDESVNYPNARFNIKRITVEEWNDLLHHTHKKSEIVNEDGNFLGASEPLDDSSVTEALIERVEELESQVTILLAKVAALENGSTDSGVTIGDWDVETPGTQTSPEDQGEEIIDGDDLVDDEL